MPLNSIAQEDMSADEHDGVATVEFTYNETLVSVVGQFTLKVLVMTIDALGHC